VTNTTNTSVDTEKSARPLAIPSVAELDIRDYFAAKALAAMIAQPDKEGSNRGANGVPTLTAFAYEYADAMLLARQS